MVWQMKDSAVDTLWAAPEPGAAPREIVSGLHWARQPLLSRVNHVNHWLLDDDGERVLFDVGPDRPKLHAWWRETLARRAPSRIVATHHHYDHIGMAGRIAQSFDVPLWISRSEWLTAQFRARPWTEEQRAIQHAHFVRMDFSEEQATEIADQAAGFAARLAPVPATYRWLIADERIRLAGRDWTLIGGEGHSPEHIALFCPEDRILIAGDQVLPTITPHIGVWGDEPEADPLQRFFDTMDRLAVLPADTLVLPSHGLPFRGLHARLRQLR